MLPTIAPIFQLKPAKLSGLLHNIDEHEAALPDFQRKWVWNAERIRDLLVSVAYRYPVGSILTIPVTDSIFQKRPFEGSYSESGGIIQWKSSPSLLVLDGQQRLTSLYQALFRKAGVVRGERIYHFYVDVQVLMSDEDGIEVGTPCFKDALFFVEERKGQRLRYQGLQLLYEITTREQELAHGVLPLSLTFAPDELNGWKGDYLASLVPNNDLRQYRDLDAKWNALVGSWLNRIREYELPEVELNKQMTLEAICYIFEKVNSAGVPLNVFDLCNAILWAQNFQLNKEWEKKVKELEPRVQMQPLDGVHYLMGINLLESLWRKRTATDGARIAVSCTREELLKLTGPVVKKWWDKLGSAYIEVARFMMAQGIISKDLLPYAPTIVPLAAVFSEILERKGAAHVTSTWPRLERWFWCCVFSRRYSSNIETNAASDFEQLLDWLDGGELPEVVRDFVFNSDTLANATTMGSVIYKGLLCLLAREGAKDFGGGGPLTVDLYLGTRQDVHHIYPAAALGAIAKADRWADSIANKTLVNAALNRSIGGRKPSEYLAILHKNAPERDFAEILATHQVDFATLARNDWTNYIKDRRERLRQLIAKVCGGNVLPFSDMPSPEPDDGEA